MAQVTDPPAAGQTRQAGFAEPTPSALPVAAAAGCGLVLGLFEITNTSIGWHLASGRWMLAERAVLRQDPFSFTAAGTPWVDHEWLFQVVVAVVEAAAGPTGLVLLRAAVAAALAALLFALGRRQGLPPAAALLFAVLAVWGARPRLFVRPELATLVLLPLVLFLVLERPLPPARRLLLLAALLALGANLHGGILAAGPLVVGIAAAQLAQSWRQRRPLRPAALEAAATVAVTLAAPLANPFGWQLWAVPFRLAHLVGQPHVPNPEWRLSTPAELPSLYLALGLALLVMALAERRLDRWLLLAMVAALALRHVRNLGIFFVVLPVVAGPALAALARAADRRPLLRRALRAPGLAAVAAALVALSAAAGDWPRFGLGYAAGWYPERAVDVLEGEGLGGLALYNDVRFGGYLVGRRFPGHQVFVDDRNEIHEPLLAEIHAILGSSDVARWEAMLGRHGIAAALVRYHPPIRQLEPSGRVLGERGFSALWFPPERWALLYWDDAAMLLVRRDAAPPELLARREYAVVRPDDLEHLARLLQRHPELAPAAAAEVARALREDPDGRRAAFAAELVGRALLLLSRASAGA